MERVKEKKERYERVQSARVPHAKIYEDGKQS